MSLDTKSLSELRGIVQALGIKLEWSWTKVELLRKIEKHTAKVLKRPTVSVEPEDQRLRTVPPARALSQAKVWEALKNYRDSGLIVTFPTPDTIYMRFEKREDSCSLRSYLRVIDACAKTVLHG